MHYIILINCVTFVPATKLCAAKFKKIFFVKNLLTAFLIINRALGYLKIKSMHHLLHTDLKHLGAYYWDFYPCIPQ